MAKWHYEFDIDGSKIEALHELLIPMKVENLGFKIIAGTPTRIRAGDKPAWQAATELADSKPRPIAHFVEGLTKAGFGKGSAYSAIEQAVRKRVIHKMKIKGANHYKRGAK